ncbi:hypothetical protein [Cyanobium sp. NIES-981]|uniref:hypothetical protein n=1 Tax=Cyanobium sp. NIES-981 TaxID=1851505 RepID=UPI0007DDD655|nr:hypothetical protein [Cyanobium sp. NIES-981]SBO44948.1 conserved protein of unknown function [Cyanobium sp. NIES-981]
MNRQGTLGRGLTLGLLQAAMLLGLGGQLLLDRALRPRGWARTQPVDPYLPIRGRYVALHLMVRLEGERAPLDPSSRGGSRSWVSLHSRGGEVLARPVPQGTAGALPARGASPAGWVRLEPPVAFFIPPAGPDPSRGPLRGSMWVEVTLPDQGRPRPIRLGVSDGELFPPRPLPLG